MILGFRSYRKQLMLFQDLFYLLSFDYESINRGRGRVIPKQKAEGVLLHRTVDMRMKLFQDEHGQAYRPRAKLIPDVEPELVD